MPQVDWSSVDWANVISTLIAVVVGGLLTLVGSMLTSTRDVRRQRRQRIYEEVLPKLDTIREWGHEEGRPAWSYDDQIWSWLTDLRRSVALTGATERWRVRRIYDLYMEYRKAERAEIAESQGEQPSPRKEVARGRYDVARDVDQAVEKYRHLLARKVRRSFL